MQMTGVKDKYGKDIGEILNIENESDLFEGSGIGYDR